MKLPGIAGIIMLSLCLALFAGCSKRRSVAITPRNDQTKSLNQSGAPGDLSEYIRTVLKISQENTAEAEEKLAELHRQKPQLVALIQVAYENARDTESRRLLAEAYFQAGLYLNAFQLYQEIKTIDPKNSDAELGLARIWNEWGDASLARQHTETAIQLDPNSARGLELLGKIHLRNNDLDAAISAYLSAINLDPDNATLYANAGYIYLARGEFESARSYLEEAVSREPFLPEAQNNLGITFGHLGDYQKALKAFTVANGRAAGLNNLGVIYMELRRWKDASNAFKEALAIDPKYQIARKNLADVEKRIPMPSVIELKPFDDEGKGVINLQAGQKGKLATPTVKNQQTVEIIAGSGTLSRKSTKDSRLSVAYNDALARFRNRHYGEAIAIFQWLLQQQPNTNSASACEYWIGECYWGLGNKEKARAAFNRVLGYGDVGKRGDAIIMLKRITSSVRGATKSSRG